MTIVFIIVEIMPAVAIAITFIRLMLGPTMVNRVVALDLMAILVVGMVASEAVRQLAINNPPVLLVFLSVFGVATSIT